MCNQVKNIAISVIIPCYNSYHLMSKCLVALENQTFKNFEVIIIDDCSSDDSYTKLKQYQKKCIIDLKIFKNNQNLGPGVSRSVGIEKAVGKYIAFCDSDDWYDYNYLEEMKASIEKEDSDLCMCDYKKKFDNGCEEIVTYTGVFSKESTVKDYIAYSKSSFCLILVKSKIIKSIIVPGLYNGEDMAVIPIIISKSNKIVCCHLPLYNYYIRNDSASNSTSKNVYKNLLLAYKYCHDNMDTVKYRSELEFIGIRYILYGVTLNYLKTSNDISKLKNIIMEFEQKFPNWKKNSYLRKYDSKYKIYLKFVEYKIYVGCRLYAKMHQLHTSK